MEVGADESQAIDFLGNELISPAENEGFLITTLDLEIQNETRKKLNFLNDKDTFVLQNN